MFILKLYLYKLISNMLFVNYNLKLNLEELRNMLFTDIFKSESPLYSSSFGFKLVN